MARRQIDANAESGPQARSPTTSEPRLALKSMSISQRRGGRGLPPWGGGGGGGGGVEDRLGASSFPGAPRAWVLHSGPALESGGSAPARAARPTRRTRTDGGADPGPPLSGAPRPTHPLPEARGRSRGRRRPAARPSRPPGGAGAGGSAPRAVAACGRSRMRRRSALGGAGPGLAGPRG